MKIGKFDSVISIIIFTNGYNYYISFINIFNEINYYMDNRTEKIHLIEIDGNYFENCFVQKNIQLS